MNYLSKPITGFLLLTSQLLSGRVIFQSAAVPGLTSYYSRTSPSLDRKRSPKLNISNHDRIMEARPKIKISLTQFDKLLEISGIILLIILWTLTALNYFQSPDTVPIHFNLSGEPDGYGSKETLLFISIIPTIVYLGLSQLNKFPHIFNYMTTITKENARRQYVIATRMVRILKVSIVVIFAIDILLTLLMTLGIFDGLGLWFLPLTIFILAVPTIYAITQSRNKNKNVV